jgi:hypothetical protein
MTISKRRKLENDKFSFEKKRSLITTDVQHKMLHKMGRPKKKRKFY